MITKDETMDLAASKAEEGWLCSEAVLQALAEALNVSSELIPRIATGFAAGDRAIRGGLRSYIGRHLGSGAQVWTQQSRGDTVREPSILVRH